MYGFQGFQRFIIGELNENCFMASHHFDETIPLLRAVPLILFKKTCTSAIHGDSQRHSPGSVAPIFLTSLIYFVHDLEEIVELSLTPLCACGVVRLFYSIAGNFQKDDFPGFGMAQYGSLPGRDGRVR